MTDFSTDCIVMIFTELNEATVLLLPMHFSQVTFIVRCVLKEHKIWMPCFCVDPYFLSNSHDD